MAANACHWADYSGLSAHSAPTLQINNSTAQRFWFAYASAHDYGAGTAVTVTVWQGTNGIGPPAIPDTLTLEIYADADRTTLLGSISLTPSAQTNTATVYLSSTPAAVGGANRCGLFRLNLHAVNTSGGVGNTYNIDADGANTTVSAGQSIAFAAPSLLRSNTTLAAALANSQGGTKPSIFGASDPVWLRATLGCAPNFAESLSGALGAIQTQTITAATGTATDDKQYGVCDNRFPASSGSQTVTVSVSAGTIALAAADGGGNPAWMNTGNATDSATFDPRLTKSFVMQVDNPNWQTPPTALQANPCQMLDTSLGYMTTRYVNANGVGINGLSVHHTLQDSGAQVAATTWDNTTATEGGQAGWCNTLQVWNASKPGGQWKHTSAVTAPSNYTSLESTAYDACVLLSISPLYRAFTAIGPATISAEDTHWSPGQDLLFGLAVLDFTAPTAMALLPRNPAGAKTALNGAQATNTGTLTVLSTTGFPSSGSLYVQGVGTLAYTGTTSTTFTGVTGGTATVLPSGTGVYQPGAQSAPGSIDLDANGRVCAYAIVGRFNQTTGVVEGLQSDYTWASMLTTPPYEFQLTESFLGSRVYVASIAAANTAAWNTANLEIVSWAVINGTVYPGGNQGEVVKALNPHTGYAIDAVQLALSGGVLGTR